MTGKCCWVKCLHSWWISDLKTHVHFIISWSICDSNSKSQGLPSYLVKPIWSPELCSQQIVKMSGQEWIRRAGPSPAMGPGACPTEACHLPIQSPSPHLKPESTLTGHLSALPWGLLRGTVWNTGLWCWLQLLCPSPWEVLHRSWGEGRGPEQDNPLNKLNENVSKHRNKSHRG